MLVSIYTILVFVRALWSLDTKQQEFLFMKNEEEKKENQLQCKVSTLVTRIISGLGIKII